MAVTPREITLAADTPTSADDEKMLSVTHTGAAVVITLDTVANQSWAAGTVLHISRDTAEQVSILTATGVTIEYPAGSVSSGGSIEIDTNGTVFLVNRSGDDVWVAGGAIVGGQFIQDTIIDSTGTTLTIGSAHVDALVRCSNTAPITVTLDVDASIPIGASGEVSQWGNGAVTFAAGTGALIVSADADYTLAGLYASAAWTKISDTTYYLRGALAVEPITPYIQSSVPWVVNDYGVPGVHGWTDVKWTVSGSYSADILYMEPVYFEEDSIITQASVNVSVASTSGSCRLGIQASDSTGASGALVADWGTVSTATTGLREITGLSTPVARGWHYVMWVLDEAANLSCVKHQNNQVGRVPGQSSQAPYRIGYAFTYATLPASPSDPTSQGTSDTGFYYPIGLTWEAA